MGARWARPPVPLGNFPIKAAGGFVFDWAASGPVCFAPGLKRCQESAAVIGFREFLQCCCWAASRAGRKPAFRRTLLNQGCAAAGFRLRRGGATVSIFGLSKHALVPGTPPTGSLASWTPQAFSSKRSIADQRLGTKRYPSHMGPREARAAEGRHAGILAQSCGARPRTWERKRPGTFTLKAAEQAGKLSARPEAIGHYWQKAARLFERAAGNFA